jgi:hypothetical protein
MKKQQKVIDLRRRMEWALINGETGAARHLMSTFKQVLFYFTFAPTEPGEVSGFSPPDIAFPKTIEAMAEEFDAREYAVLEMEEEG